MDKVLCGAILIWIEENKNKNKNKNENENENEMYNLISVGKVVTVQWLTLTYNTKRPPAF